MNVKTKKKLLALSALMLTLVCVLTAFPVGASAANGERLRLIPGGMTFGVQLQTRGVLVSGITEVNTDKGRVSPAREAQIRAGDIIYEVNSRQINTVDALTEEVERSCGEELSLSVERNGQNIQKKITPVLSSDCGEYRTGVIVKDNTAGIGTITFIDAQTHAFGGLGHGICDFETGVLMPMHKGRVCGVRITDIKKGRKGTPGELKGYFTANKTGALTGNTPQGVFGVLDTPPENLMDPVEIMEASELKTGRAYIYSALDSKAPEKYEIKILRIADRERDSKNFIIEVTDERLLEKTGGIVQGMSGSPIIQNGRLAGAVTHVMINDPTVGYGIFIENMLNAAQMPMAKAS